MQSVSCEECQGEARLVTSVAAFGATPGARFYQCTDCRHLQVEEFAGTLAPPQPRVGFGREGT